MFEKLVKFMFGWFKNKENNKKDVKQDIQDKEVYIEDKKVDIQPQKVDIKSKKKEEPKQKWLFLREDLYKINSNNSITKLIKDRIVIIILSCLISFIYISLHFKHFFHHSILLR